MQFRKRTNVGAFGSLIRILIKVMFFFIIILLLVVLVDKIKFPYPNKKIEKIIPNENFKVVK
tara:strand:- start:324 stop:509 length:186 start_codon:yes stop_codon:yes gene_type:complete